MPEEERDRELVLLGIKVSRNLESPRGLYWNTTRCGYNMAVFLNQTDPDVQRPYEWYVGTYGCSFTADGKEISLDAAVLEAHKRLARYILERSQVEQGVMSFLMDPPLPPTRFEREPVL